MYSNTVTLIGFLGGDPDRRETKNNNAFTVLSLATKTSWKNKQSGEWESRTEWHRAIAYGKLAEFAATLKKGAHVQIQGELRSREYEKALEGKKKATVKQRIWEIQVSSILKLDRAQRSDEPGDTAAPAAEDTEVAQ
jgi:single-strand DNA-binding protein